MKLLTFLLITVCLLVFEYSSNAQDIQFRLNCSNTTCGFSIKNLAGDTVLKTFGNGQTLIKTTPSLLGSYFAVNRGTNWIFDVGNYSNRNFVSVNGALVATHLITDSIGSATTGGDVRITPFLRLSGSGCYTGTWNQCSDIKLKKNISPIENSLYKILNLKGVTYQWRKEEFASYKFESGEKIGLIAQDVEKVFPELVRTESDGMKSVNYSNLTAVLVEAMKEQQKIITEQEMQIKKQEQELAGLKEHQNSLEVKISEQQEKINLILSKMKGQ